MMSMLFKSNTMGASVAGLPIITESPGFSGVLLALSLVFCSVLYEPLLVFLFCIFCSLHCMSFNISTTDHLGIFTKNVDI